MNLFLRLPRLFTCLLMVFSLASCAYVPISSIYKLRNFDLFTTDIRELRVAARVPNDIEIPTGGVRMIFTAEESKPAPWTEEFLFEKVADRNSLERLERQGTQVHAFRIAPTDLDRFQRTREKAEIEQAEGRSGSMEIMVDACYTTDDMPARIPVSTFINASETNGYVAMWLCGYVAMWL